MRWANSKETAELWVTENMDGMPVHKAAADMVLKDSRPPKNKQIFVDAFKYAKPAFTTPYGQRPMSIFKSAVAPVFNNGGNVRQAVTEAMVAVRTAMDEEVAADVKKLGTHRARDEGVKRKHLILVAALIACGPSAAPGGMPTAAPTLPPTVAPTAAPTLPPAPTAAPAPAGTPVLNTSVFARGLDTPWAI